MKKLLSLTAALCMACSMGFAHAADAGKSAEKPLTPHQTKTQTCSQQAKAEGKKGAERKAFMKECLGKDKHEAAARHDKKHSKTAAHHASKEKRKECNKQAKTAGKKGAERKAFIKTCMAAA